MHRDKGIFEILDVAYYQDKYSFLFIGKFADNTEEISFRKKISKMQNVEWLGPVYDMSKINYIKNSKVFLMPTKSDVFPMSIIESLLCGTIPFVPPIGSIPEIVESGQNGFYIGINCPKSTARQIDSLLKNDFFAQNISNKCVEMAYNNFTAEVVMNKLKRAIVT